MLPNPIRHVVIAVSLAVLTGCASAHELLGIHSLDIPPEFNQKIVLIVDDSYYMHQAPASGYDVGDLQSFHTQHTLPIVIEDAFREMFGDVKRLKKGANIETQAPDVPAIFEVRIIDVANDRTIEFVETYRAEVTLAVAMRSPRDNIFWQKAFRGDGFVQVNNSFSTNLGPDQALQDAMRDAIEKMQKGITTSPEVAAQMKYYQDIEKARRETEIKI
ncbi:MAG: hypothetical protein JW893_00320 [Candidatus Omnitrophica bacterium]|nr:hypothetical protein [Candidatus Omnitrophota bacterium]